jgi:hypothetical protein
MIDYDWVDGVPAVVKLIKIDRNLRPLTDRVIRFEYTQLRLAVFDHDKIIEK